VRLSGKTATNSLASQLEAVRQNAASTVPDTDYEDARQAHQAERLRLQGENNRLQIELASVQRAREEVEAQVQVSQGRADTLASECERLKARAVPAVSVPPSHVGGAADAQARMRLQQEVFELRAMLTDAQSLATAKTRNEEDGLRRERRWTSAWYVLVFVNMARLTSSSH
jgi:hypothetical protein